MLLRRPFCYLLLLCAFSMCRKNTVVDHTDVIIPPPPPIITYDLVADTQQVNDAFGGYYAALPPHYNGSTEKYPLLLFLHGLGQRGNGKDELKYLLYDG